MNTPVSFELAKLLKEKGFDLKVRSMYCEEKLHKNTYSTGNYNDVKWVRTWRNSPYDDTISAPTIADVCMWLYDKYNIWISVDPEIDSNTWFHTITHGKSITAFGNYSGPIEAYEKGIEHILNEMI